jgi:hypothetical protein
LSPDPSPAAASAGVIKIRHENMESDYRFVNHAPSKSSTWRRLPDAYQSKA